MALPLTVQQLLVPQSQATFRAMGVQILQSLGLKPQNWPPGGVGSTLLTYSAQVLATLSSQLANSIAAQWVTTATQGGLGLLSQLKYGVQPPQGTFANGNLVLTNAGGGSYTFLANTALFASVVANAQGQFPLYTNVSDFTLNPTSSLTIQIQCINFLGSLGNAADDDVTSLVTAMLGVTATNPDPIVGVDPLSDDALRQLDLDSIQARSPFGPEGAFTTAIQNAVNSVTGNPVNINRNTISENSHTGQVNVVICGPDGTTDPNDLTGVVTSIQNSATALGVTVTVSAATTVNEIDSVTPWVKAPSNTSPVSVQATIAAALAAFIGSPLNKIGGVTAFDPSTGSSFTGLQATTLFGVAASAVATAYPGAILISMAGLNDTPLLTGQVAVDRMTINLPVML